MNSDTRLSYLPKSAVFRFHLYFALPFQFLKDVMDSSVEFFAPFPILRDVSRRCQDLIICYVLLARKDIREDWKLENYLKPVQLCSK